MQDRVRRLLAGYRLLLLQMFRPDNLILPQGAFSSGGFTPMNFITVATPHLGAWRPSSAWRHRTFNDLVPPIASWSGYQVGGGSRGHACFILPRVCLTRPAQHLSPN